jgi:hypothetical protein
MADFDVQPVWDGVGDFHLNRYRIAFEQPANVTKETLAQDFINNFPTYLNSPYATVTFPGRTFNGKPTLKFWGALKLLRGHVEGNPDAHHDWVVREWMDPRIGQTAQTLCRNFYESPDDVAAGGGGAAAGSVGGGLAAGPVGSLAGAIVGGVLAVEVNRKHFLAGRRSWRVDDAAAFGQSPADFLSQGSSNILMLETAAVERLSSRAFTVGDYVIGIEKRVPDIWISNLQNFVKMKGLKPVPILTPQPDDLWLKTTLNWVRYYANKFADFGALSACKQFTDMLPLYPTILPPRS